MKLVKFILVLAILFISTNILAAPAEIWLRVKVNGNFVSKYIEVFEQGYDGAFVFFDSGYSTSSPSQNGSNAFGDVGDNNSSNPTWSPMNFTTNYLIKIEGRYCRINIGYHSGTPDIVITVNDGGFTETEHHNTIRMVSQGNWNAKTVTIKNSFNSGKVIIDGVQENSGITKSFGSPTFPHFVKAKQNQTSSGFTQVFQEWQKFSGYHNDDIESPIYTESAIYTANFLDQYYVTFQNSFGGGTIKVNDNTENSQTSTYHVLKNNDIKGQALWQIVNGIEYTFDHWDNGSTNNPETFTINNGHKTITAYFNGKPENSYRNLHFNNSRDPVGTSIKVMWNQHPNSNVTKYKIYRQTKFGSPQLIKTVNRTSASSYTSIDNAYAITNNTGSNNLLWYDVRAYYSTEGTVSDDDWRAVYGEINWKIAADDGEIKTTNVEEVLEYGMSNYPNPFNPTTTIHYQLPEDANVSIKVFDILGKQVAELVSGTKGVGKHNVMFNSSNLSAGLYIYTIEAKPTSLNGKGFNKTNKMLLLK